MSKKKDTFTGNYYGALVGIGVGALLLGGYAIIGVIVFVILWLSGVFKDDE